MHKACYDFIVALEHLFIAPLFSLLITLCPNSASFKARGAGGWL
jgi:hypothetical protein